MKHAVDGGTLHYETLGGGPPLLLMHGGLGLDHTTLRPWLDPLSSAFELIYYDHLGNGRSAFEGDPETLTHDVWVDTADSLREHLGHEQLTVFGHSYGGLLALEYTLRHPERVGALILSNVAPVLDYPDMMMANARRKAPDEGTYEAVVELLSAPVAGDEAWASGFRRISPLYFHDYDPAEHDAVLADVRFRADPLNRSTFGCLPAYDVRPGLGSIETPTLVVSGADDWIMPPEHGGERVAAGIAGAEHVTFQESGHWPFVEETDRFLDTVQSWAARRSLSGAGAGSG